MAAYSRIFSRTKSQFAPVFCGIFPEGLRKGRSQLPIRCKRFGSQFRYGTSLRPALERKADSSFSVRRVTKCLRSGRFIGALAAWAMLLEGVRVAYCLLSCSNERPESGIK